MGQILVITSSDDVSLKLVGNALKNASGKKTYVLIQKTSATRIVGLLSKARVDFFWILQMAYARIRQKIKLADTTPATPDGIIHSNADLIQFLESHPEIDTLLCFRAGLIINRKVLSRINGFNIHCARIPEYAGLASIKRAMDQKDYLQEATLHRLVEKVDHGETLKTKPVKLDPALPYWKNELHAYSVGADLLSETIRIGSYRSWLRPDASN